MSFFSETLRDLLNRAGKSQQDLSRESGVNNSKISRLMTDEQTHIDCADMEAIANAITEDPRERARLLAAHLQDECRGPGADLIRIIITSPTVLEDYPFEYLSPEVEDAIRKLRHHIPVNAPLRQVVINLTRLLGAPTRPTAADKEPIKYSIKRKKH